MLQAMSKLNLLEYLKIKDILLLLILILFCDLVFYLFWFLSPDQAVIVHSQGGWLGVIGWGADCFCLRTKTSVTNGTQTKKMLTTILISISTTNEGEHLIYEDVRHPDEVCLAGDEVGL